MSRAGKTLILILSQGAEALVLILIAASLSRLLTKPDYATYRQTLLTYEFIAPLLALGLPAAIFYFLSNHPESGKTIVRKIRIVFLFAGLAFLVFCLVGGKSLIANIFHNDELNTTLTYFAVYPLLILPFSILSPVLLVQDKSTLVPKINVPLRVCQFAAVVSPVFFFGPEPIYAVYGLVVFSVVACIATSVLLKKHTPEDDPDAQGVSAKTLLAYSIPLCLASVVEGMAMKIDRVLVSSLCSKEDFAVFVNGSMEIPFIGIITGSVMAIILPEIMKNFKKRDKQSAMGLWRRAAEKVALVLLPIGGALFVIAPELMVILYGSGFEESSQPFRLYMFLMPARIVAFGAIFQAMKRTDLILKRSIGTLILNALVSYPLVKWYGINGAAYGTLAVFWIYVIPYCLGYVSKLTETELKRLLPYKRIAIVMMLTIIGVVIPTLLLSTFEASFLVSLITKGAVYGLIVFCGLYLFYKDEVMEYVLKIKKKFAR